MVAPDGDVYAFLTPGYTEGELQIEGGGLIVAAMYVIELVPARRRRPPADPDGAKLSVQVQLRRRHLA